MTINLNISINKLSTFGEVLEARERLANKDAATLPDQSAKAFGGLVLGLSDDDITKGAIGISAYKKFGPVCADHRWTWHSGGDGSILQCSNCCAFFDDKKEVNE